MMKPPSACRHLNNKAYFLLPVPNDDKAHETPRCTTFWCGHTLQPIGPDEGDVREDCCGPGRDCYEPEVEL